MADQVDPYVQMYEDLKKRYSGVRGFVGRFAKSGVSPEGVALAKSPLVLRLASETGRQPAEIASDLVNEWKVGRDLNAGKGKNGLIPAQMEDNYRGRFASPDEYISSLEVGLGLAAAKPRTTSAAPVENLASPAIPPVPQLPQQSGMSELLGPGAGGVMPLDRLRATPKLSIPATSASGASVQTVPTARPMGEAPRFHVGDFAESSMVNGGMAGPGSAEGFKKGILRSNERGTLPSGTNYTARGKPGSYPAMLAVGKYRQDVDAAVGEMDSTNAANRAQLRYADTLAGPSKNRVNVTATKDKWEQYEKDRDAARQQTLLSTRGGAANSGPVAKAQADFAMKQQQQQAQLDRQAAVAAAAAGAKPVQEQRINVDQTVGNFRSAFNGMTEDKKAEKVSEFMKANNFAPPEQIDAWKKKNPGMGDAEYGKYYDGWLNDLFKTEVIRRSNLKPA